MFKIKICGMRESANIEEVAKLNPDLMGFIFYPKSTRFVGEDFDLSGLQIPMAGIETVAVFVNENFGKASEIIRKHHFKYAQLHGNESIQYCYNLKKDGVKILKAFGIHESFDWDSLEPYQEVCDYFLFDTSTSNYGGSGKKFLWNLLDNYHGSTSFFLSGGIDPEDAAQLRQISHPCFAGIDINSRFEIEPGLKDANLLEAFLTKLKTI